jgi:Alpha/beta hydrolase domain
MGYNLCMRFHLIRVVVCLIPATVLASIVVPEVTGPVKWTAQPPDASHGYPFNSSVIDLKTKGYVEEEFFIAGTANRYAVTPGATGSVTDGGHAYKTRIVVRRPSDPKKFNGTVLVEWTNVTGSRDLEMDWFQSAGHFVDAGYVWIGVSAQRVGVDALKVWSPERYGSLDVTEGGTIKDDAMSYDIVAGTALLVQGKGKDILGGLKAERVIATGHSQSAARLGGYVNSIHPLNPVFDGVILHGGGGMIRADLGTLKVWKMLSETDVRGPATHQADTANLRTWEVAGTSHVDSQSAWEFAGIARLNAVAPVPGAAPAPAQPCDKPSYSQVPFRYVFNAAYDHMARWIKDGTPPPSAPPIEFTNANPPVIARDESGIAHGGIRLAEEAVPTAQNTGQNSGPAFCRLNGSHIEFDAARLAALYPSHKAYADAVRTVTEKNLKAGYILKADADATISAAEHSKIGIM